MQNNDIVAYITEEYIKEELENGKLIKLELGIESPALEYGIYYNSNNKIKNVNNWKVTSDCFHFKGWDKNLVRLNYYLNMKTNIKLES